MRTLIRASLASVLSLFVFVGPVSAATNQAMTVAQATQSGTVTGHVTGDNGAGLSAAQVLIEGSGQRQTTTTDDSGNFTASLPAGLYTITVVKAGFQTGSNDVTVTSGTSTDVTVGLTQASLNDLNVIGRTSSSGGTRAAKFNISSTATQSLSQSQLLARNTPDLTQLLNELPGVTIPHATSNPNQSFVIRGLRYETRTLLDGHSVSSGTGGAFLTNYASAAIFGSADIVKGAGIDGPGTYTVNLRTPDFTSKDSGYLQGGVDSYGGTFFTAFANINVGKKLQFVFGKAFTGYRGPTYNQQEPDYSGATPALGTFNIPNLPNGVVQYIDDFSNTYSLNAELAKMRINFSDSTSLAFGFLGLQGRFDPQGGAYGQTVGNLTVPQCLTAGVAANGAGCTPTSTYNSPGAQSLIGQTVTAYAFYPGSDVRQNQPNFNADFKTTFKNDTILFRPYTAAINRLIDGTKENLIPGDAGPWFQVTNSANCQVAFSGAVAGIGAKGPCYAAGSQPTNAYVNDPNTPHVYNASGAPLVCTPTTPCYTSTTSQNNGGQYGFGAPYTTLELDKLAGYTFSYIHPVGANTYNVSFDHYFDDTQSFVNDASPLAAGCQFTLGTIANTPGTVGYQPTCPLANLRPSPISVPETFASVSTLAATAQFQLTPKLELDFGGYFTHYLINAQTLTPIPAAYTLAARTGAYPISLVGATNSAAHFDPHFGLLFRPTRDIAVRFTAGSSLNIPYASLVSGFTTYQQGSTSTTVSSPNINLLPEELVTLDLGTDYRTPDGTVVSGDIYNTVVHNPWLTPKILICGSTAACAAQFPALGVTAQGYTSQTVNGAQQYAQGFEVSVAREPAVGFGYRVNTSFERNYYLGTPASFFVAPQVFYNGSQFQSTGSGSTSVPYSKGYAEVQYAAKNHGLLRFGADYEGPNNSYNAPAFWLFDAGASVNTGFHDVLLGGTVENLFNQNFNALLGRGLEYQGLTPLTGTTAPGGYTYGRGTFNTALVNPGPITFRVTLTKQF